MEDLHLYIYNEIGGFGVTEQEIQEEISNAGNFNELFVHINSPGGYVDTGTTIGNLIKATGKKSTALIEGFCGSIATRIALSCDTVKIAPNAMFMIHFASVGIDGNKEDLGKAVKELGQIDEQLIKEYQSKTSIARDEIVQMMRDEKTMTGEEAVRLGFADELMENIKAVAKFEMKDNEEKLNVIDNIINKLTFLISGAKNQEDEKDPEENSEIKNVELTLEDGTMLFVFSDDGELEGKAVVLADEEGRPTDTPAPDGNHRLNDNRMITVENGVVTSVMEDSPEDAEKEQLKAKIAELENQLNAKATEEVALADKLKELTNKYDQVEEQIKNLASNTPIGSEFNKQTQIVNPPNKDASKQDEKNASSGLDPMLQRIIRNFGH